MKKMLATLGLLTMTTFTEAKTQTLSTDTGYGGFVAYCLVKKNSGISYEEFRTHEIETHAPLVMDLPGLQDYRLMFFPPQAGEAQACDAMARVTFASEADHDAALASEAGQRALADLPNVVDASAMFRLAAGAHDAYAAEFGPK